MNPLRVLLFLLLCLSSIVLVAFLFPKNGLKISDDKTVSFVDINSYLKPKVDSSKIIEEKKLEEKKSLQERKQDILKKTTRTLVDTLVLLQVAATESNARFYYSSSDYSVMDKFFDALERVKSDNTSYRIIHYGDSQIEMDRISSNLREKLQKRYGGGGPGLLPAFEVTPKYTVGQEATGIWKRKLTFGSNEWRASHNRYGPMAYFCKKESDPSSIIIAARDNSTFKNKQFKTCKVLVGALDRPLDISVATAGKVIGNKTLLASPIEQIVEFDMDSTNGKVGIKFTGANADILGISLDDHTGISVDNIPMRGCSGTIFRRINSETLKRTYQMLGVKALILQFGGNALPGMKSKSSADAYGKKFYEELMYLKSIDPNLIIFVIGPADMSVREGGVLKTHSQLENVRDALKQATINAGGIFWDMYEAMGGNGSMIDWVKQKPSLGSPDYIHFTQKGASKISEIFYESLMKEYEMHQLKQKVNAK